MILLLLNNILNEWRQDVSSFVVLPSYVDYLIELSFVVLSANLL